MVIRNISLKMSYLKVILILLLTWSNILSSIPPDFHLLKEVHFLFHLFDWRTSFQYILRKTNHNDNFLEKEHVCLSKFIFSYWIFILFNSILHTDYKKVKFLFFYNLAIFLYKKSVWHHVLTFICICSVASPI